MLINFQHVIIELNFMLIVHSKTKMKDYHLSNIRAKGLFYFLVFTFTQQNKEMWSNYLRGATWALSKLTSVFRIQEVNQGATTTTSTTNKT